MRFQDEFLQINIILDENDLKLEELKDLKELY